MKQKRSCCSSSWTHHESDPGPVNFTMIIHSSVSPQSWWYANRESDSSVLLGVKQKIRKCFSDTPFIISLIIWTSVCEKQMSCTKLHIWRGRNSGKRIRYCSKKTCKTYKPTDKKSIQKQKRIKQQKAERDIPASLEICMKASTPLSP